MHNSTTQTLTAVLPTSLWLLISILGCARRYTSRCSLVLQCSRFRLFQNYGYGLSVLRLQDCSATSRFDCMEFHAWHATRWGFHGFRRACQHLLLGFGDSRNMSFKGLWEQGSHATEPRPVPGRRSSKAGAAEMLQNSAAEAASQTNLVQGTWWLPGLLPV